MCKRLTEKTVSVREIGFVPTLQFNGEEEVTPRTVVFSAEHYQPRTYVSSVTIILVR